MKALIYTLLLVSALACGTWAYCNSLDAKTNEARLRAQKSQAEANIARAKAMEAKEQAETERLRKEAAEKELAAKSAAREEAKHKAEEAQADERAMAEERKKAVAEAQKAEENRRKAEADAEAARDRRKAAEAAVKLAEATNETLHVELALAREKTAKAELDVKAKEASRAAEELKKADYDALLKSVREVEAVLREREESTRPDRTLKDLLADNEVEAAEVEYTPEERAEMAAAESNRVTKIARRQEPRTRGDDAMDRAEARLGRIAQEGSKVVHGKARARLEALARRAAREGRTAAAEYYLAQAEELFSDDLGKDAGKSADKEPAADDGAQPPSPAK